MTWLRVFCCLCILALHPLAGAHIHRSAAARHAFQIQHPCPSTGERRGKCAGYVIDHRISLCVGGHDIADNMRWMSMEGAKVKDRWECKPGWENHLKECEANGCFVSG